MEVKKNGEWSWCSNESQRSDSRNFRRYLYYKDEKLRPQEVKCLPPGILTGRARFSGKITDLEIKFTVLFLAMPNIFYTSISNLLNKKDGFYNLQVPSNLSQIFKVNITLEFKVD